MAIKQPRVPEYREGEGTEGYIRSLILFLKDFCQEVWTESGQAGKKIASIRYPVTSVNGKTGEVSLGAQDVGARAKDWTPTAEQVGALPSGGTAVNATKFNNQTWAQMLKTVYPVGAVYLSTSSTSPASLFGGTWEQMKDRFLLGAGGTYTAGSTGGAATVTLTTSQIPSHDHKLQLVSPHTSSGDRSTSYVQYGYNGAENTFYTNANAMENTGGGGSHNNMPPYLAVYMWKRVS